MALYPYEQYCAYANTQQYAKFGTARASPTSQ